MSSEHNLRFNLHLADSLTYRKYDFCTANKKINRLLSYSLFIKIISAIRKIQFGH